MTPWSVDIFLFRFCRLQSMCAFLPPFVFELSYSFVIIKYSPSLQIMAGIENLIEELLLKKGEVDSGVRSIYLLFVAR